jgi:hypothetical protein
MKEVCQAMLRWIGHGAWRQMVCMSRFAFSLHLADRVSPHEGPGHRLVYYACSNYKDASVRTVYAWPNIRTYDRT